MRSFKFFKILSAFLLCASPLSVSGQSRQTPKRDVLPRIGIIENEDLAGWKAPGCDSHLLSFKKGSDDLFYASHTDGVDALMNLDGRLVEMKLLKTTLYNPVGWGAEKAVYEYRYQKIRITVSLPLLYDYTTWLPAKVVMRKGRALRTIRAFVTPQCDAS